MYYGPSYYNIKNIKNQHKDMVFGKKHEKKNCMSFFHSSAFLKIVFSDDFLKNNLFDAKRQAT